ncbi:MAG TPA: glycosyltransferase [Acidobacteriaceae bacterium]|nr:glycosyltransferase [Acidobacteriaceae bacterium]
MHFVALALFAIAVLGSISSTVFLGMALVGAARFRAQARSQAATAAAIPSADLPPVSLLKPLHGMEPQLEENLESFFQQDYPNFEILFGVDTDDDAALPLACALAEKYPHIPSRVMVTGEPPWPNPPAYCFYRMSQHAQHEILVTSDSDVIVDKSYLRDVVAPLLAPKTGMVTCVYRGLNRGGFWSRLDAVGMSVEMTAGVLVANMLEGIKFGLGPTIAVRRDALDAIGGYPAIGDYFANDFIIGNKIDAAGFEVALSGHIISHVVAPMSLRQMWQRHVRWATSTRRSRPMGHFGSGLVYATPYGLLALIAGFAAGMPGIGAGLFVWSLLNRVIEAVAIGWGITRCRECLVRPWLYPVRDLAGFIVWAASYTIRRMKWRNGRFELIADGRIQMRDRNGNVVTLSQS